VEIIAAFTVTDLVVLVTLAGGVLIGFQQGTLRFILCSVSVLVAFILASLLKGPIADALAPVWRAAAPEQQELWIYVVLFVAGILGGWFVVRAFFRQTRLPLYRLLDEIGGAVMGVLYVVLLYTFSLVTLDTYFGTIDQSTVGVVPVLGALYEFLNDSLLVDWFRAYVLPVAGFVARPFVPGDVKPFLGL
jgi:uncharacterized membrane protein required for colicin V production